MTRKVKRLLFWGIVHLVLWGSIFMVFTVFTGCGTDEDENGDGHTDSRCITCGETITWTSYGRYEFNNAGSDSTARGIVSKCGWHVHGGHNGGYGDTLQVASCVLQDCPPETDNPYEADFVEDFCQVALLIHYLPFEGSGSSTDATVDDDEPDLFCIYNEHTHSVWYYFEALEDGYVTADTSGSNFDTVVAAFQGNDCSDLEQIDCDDDSGASRTSKIVFPVLAGEIYYLLVGSYYYANAGGTLVLNVNFRECIPENEGVVLVWAYQKFKGFRVRERWTGSTAEGIQIGSTLQEFITTYPYFYELYNNIWKYEEDGIRVRATFDQDERLEELMVGHYFRN